MLFAPSGKGRKRQKKGEKGRFRSISGKGGQTPLKPPFVTPPFAAAREKSRKSLKITFRTFFWLFRGPGSGGPKLLSGDFFETFRVFGVLGSVDGQGAILLFCASCCRISGDSRPAILESRRDSRFAILCCYVLD